MILSKKQTEYILKGFWENNDADRVEVTDEMNGSGIGSDTFARFTRTRPTKNGFIIEELCNIDITDVGTW